MRYEVPGLRADWLNGWLAAIGVTVLVPGARLSWAEAAVPFAVVEVGDSADLAEAITGALPTPETLARCTIAKALTGTEHAFKRNVTIAAYRERAAIERSLGGGILAASVSDLRGDVNLNDLEHGAFDPAAPHGETLWTRALACARVLARADISERVRITLSGPGRRDKLNGLGFDALRRPPGVHSETAVYADPVIELLVFAALQIFPTRGDGRQIRQRMWTGDGSRRGSFRWYAWRPALNCWAIDAMLDQPHRTDSKLVIAEFRVVPYRRASSKEVYCAYFAERVL